MKFENPAPALTPIYHYSPHHLPQAFHEPAHLKHEDDVYVSGYSAIMFLKLFELFGEAALEQTLQTYVTVYQ